MMGDQSSEEIKITKAELSAGWVDETLAQVNQVQTIQHQLLHAVIRHVGDQYEIEHQNTASGTFVNRRKIHQGRLKNGDQIELGQVVLQFIQPD